MHFLLLVTDLSVEILESRFGHFVRWTIKCDRKYFLHVFLLGAFAKLRTATVSFVLSVCSSVLMDQMVPTGRIFVKFDI